MCELAFGQTAAFSAENWPSVTITDEARSQIKERFEGPFAAYHDSGYRAFLGKYGPRGDYLRWSQRSYHNEKGLVFDQAGMPMATHEGVAYYNPVTISHYALTLHGRLVNGDLGARRPFLAAVRKLISMQSADGGFRYPIRLKHHHFTFEPGWLSAMAQGNALSVLARALKVENDPAFRRAGDLALSALLRSTAEGGTTTTLAGLDPSLNKYIFFEEYPSKPIHYTLNGYIFALLGLFDWSHVGVDSGKRAAQAFTSGVLTLGKILPLYDIDGISSYDLSHIVLKEKPYTPMEYLGVHVYLLHAINSIKSNPVIEAFEKIWTEKIAQLNRPPRFVRFDFSRESPQPVGGSLTINVKAMSDPPTPHMLYEFQVKHNGVWTVAQPYSEKDSFVWMPKDEGQYWISFLAKAADSELEYDNLRVLPFDIIGRLPETTGTKADH